MSDSRRDLPRLVGDLTETVEALQSELEPDRRPPLRPPTPGELARFTSEVTIPAIVIVLETNVRLLKLLQRTLRMAEGREGDAGAGETRERAASLGRATLSRVDAALSDLQDALEGRPPDDEARDLLSQARDLRAEIDERLADGTRSGAGRQAASDDRTQVGEPSPSHDRDPVDIDVESELRSLKDNIDDEGDGTDQPDDPTDGGG